MQVVAKRVGLVACVLGAWAVVADATPLVFLAAALGVIGLVAFLLDLLGVAA